MTARIIGLTLLVGVLAGCTVYTPEVWRERCRRTYYADVNLTYEETHRRLLSQMHTVGWGEKAFVRQTIDTDKGYGTMAAHYPHVREPIGFIIDVHSIGDGLTRVTVYPQSKFYGDKVRRWLDDLGAGPSIRVPRQSQH